MPTNDFQVFAGAGNANVQTQQQFLADASVPTGFVAGTARSAIANKLWRQHSIPTAMLGAFINARTGLDAIDDGTTATLLTNFIQAIAGTQISSARTTTGASVTYSPSMNGQLLLRSNFGSLMLDTLPAGIGTFIGTIKNMDTAPLVITPGAGALLDGVSTSIVLGKGQTLIVCCLDGTNYYSLRRPDRFRLSAPLVLYVSATGNDSNHGLAAGAPFGTLAAAVNYVYNNLDANGFALAINVGAGTFAGGVNVGGNTSVNLVINGAGATQTTIQGTNVSAISVSAGTLGLQNLTLASTGAPGNPYVSGGYDLTVIGAGNVGLQGGVAFGAAGIGQMFVAAGGQITTGGNSYSITGSSQYHMVAFNGGRIIAESTVVTVVNNPNFSGAFANASECGVIDVVNASYSGAATGPRYLVNLNGVIATGSGANPNFFPGSSVGSYTSGGVYT